MASEVDISWDVLRQIARDWAGTSAELEGVQPLVGGSIATTLALAFKGGRKAVLKITPHRIDRAHADEAWQLALLREKGLPVPEVYTWHIGTLENPFSYILMEFVEGMNLTEARAACSADEYEQIQSHMAELVLRLHAVTGSHYMRVSGPDPKRFEKWHECYRDIFDAILRDAEKSPLLPTKCRKTIRKAHEKLDRLLAHDDCPRLVHWDLWATNMLAGRADDGTWRIAALLDPNCKYAHAEAEIAYLELFHTCTPTFLKAYQQQRKLSPDYHRVRKPVYQLYNLLNHLRLFGPEYKTRVLEAIEKVGALV